MKMIQLTDMGGHTIYLNPAHIVSFCRTKGSSRTIVAMDDKSTWHAKESPEEIVAIMANRDAIKAAQERNKASYQEAVETLKANYPDARYTQLCEAVDMAISALERVEMLDELELDKLERCGLKEQSND